MSVNSQNNCRLLSPLPVVCLPLVTRVSLLANCSNNWLCRLLYGNRSQFAGYLASEQGLVDWQKPLYSQHSLHSPSTRCRLPNNHHNNHHNNNNKNNDINIWISLFKCISSVLILMVICLCVCTHTVYISHSLKINNSYIPDCQWIVFSLIQYMSLL